MKIKILALCVCAVVCMGSPIFADNGFVKLGRGMTNVVTGAGELIRQPVLMSEDYDPVTSFFGGICKGVLATVVRVSAGVYEIVTFPIPLPKGYEAIMEPATVFE